MLLKVRNWDKYCRGGRASKSLGIERALACGIPQSSGIEQARASDGRAHSSSSEYRASNLRKNLTFQS